MYANEGQQLTMGEGALTQAYIDAAEETSTQDHDEECEGCRQCRKSRRSRGRK